MLEAVLQLLCFDKNREERFSLGENHEKAYRFGPHQLRNCVNRKSILATVLSLPQQFTAPDTATVDVSPHANASDPEFWHSFNDAELSSLVQRALTANNDLRAALAHYDSANALLREAKFDRIPTVTMSTSVGRQRFSAD